MGVLNDEGRCWRFGNPDQAGLLLGDNDMMAWQTYVEHRSRCEGWGACCWGIDRVSD